MFEKLIAMETDECVIWPFGVFPQGYPCVNIDRQSYMGHRLALERRVGPPPGPKYDAAHAPLICHERRCLNYRHLRWATRAENSADSRVDGTMVVGEAHPGAKLTEADVRAIRAAWAAGGVSQTKLAATHGVVQSVVSAIVAGRTWRHLLPPTEGSPSSGS